MKARQEVTGLPAGGSAIDVENIADGVRGLVLQRFDSSISMLKDPDIPAPQLVHELRKNMKNVRAGLRLLSDAGQLDLADLENECGEIGRKLSRLRDYDVVLETLPFLEGAPTKGRDSEAWKRFEELLHDERKILLESGLLGDEWREDTVDRLDQAARLLTALDIPVIAMEPFQWARNLARRKARKALRKLNDEPGDEGFHRLRKRSKRELYQRRFLQAHTGTGDHGITDQLDLLCRELGLQQDVIVLIGLAESHGLLTEGLDQWLNSHLRRLRVQAKALAAGLYD